MSTHCHEKIVQRIHLIDLLRMQNQLYAVIYDYLAAVRLITELSCLRAISEEIVTNYLI